MWVDVKVRSQAFRLSPNPDLILPTIFLFFIISLNQRRRRVNKKNRLTPGNPSA